VKRNGAGKALGSRAEPSRPVADERRCSREWVIAALLQMLVDNDI
jgi:hypothetical protein